MTLIKMNKHQVYGYISDHPEWFKRRNGEEQYLTCSSIEYKINEILRNAVDDIFKADFIVSRGATLTALVHDGFLVREYCDYAHCYSYCPVQTDQRRVQSELKQGEENE